MKKEEEGERRGSHKFLQFLNLPSKAQMSGETLHLIMLSVGALLLPAPLLHKIYTIYTNIEYKYPFAIAQKVRMLVCGIQLKVLGFKSWQG